MSVKEKKKKDAEEHGCLEGGSTCARSIVSGVYFDGLGGEGARLHRVSVGGAVQAAVTHSVQVAAICPKTRRRYRGQDASRAPVVSLRPWQKQTSPRSSSAATGNNTEFHSTRLIQAICLPVCVIVWAWLCGMEGSHSRCRLLKGLAGRGSALAFRVCGFTRMQEGVKSHTYLSSAFSVFNEGWMRRSSRASFVCSSRDCDHVLFTLTDAQTQKLEKHLSVPDMKLSAV